MARRRIYNLLDEFRRVQRKMDELFEDLLFQDFGTRALPSEGSKGEHTLIESYEEPLSDFYETDKEVVAEVEVPGIDKKDIQVYVYSDGIEIKADVKKEDKQEDKKKGIFRFERTHSGFYRYFRLPKYVDPDKASAEYKNGILIVRVPKKAHAERSKHRVDIK